MQLVKMINPASGKVADVHPSMVDDYTMSGFVVVEAEPEKKRGKPAKKDAE